MPSKLGIIMSFALLRLCKALHKRKNWLFIGSHRAGIAMAALLSLVQTCRAMDINPQAYLEDLFRRLLDPPASQLEDFLPDIWQANHTPPQDQ